MIIPRIGLIASIGFVLLAPRALVHGQNSFSEDIRKMPAPAQAEPRALGPANQAGATDTPPISSLPPAGSDPRFVAVAAVEAKDFGVAPSHGLHSDPMHAPTPTRIEGGTVITTEALSTLSEKPGSFILFDVLGAKQRLPRAQNALAAGRGGSFTDGTQREFGNYLQSVTRGHKDLPLVFYCQSAYCWMSYNAALRAINLGYTKVFWYRGGLEAWQQAGLPTEPTGGSRGQ